MMKRFEQQLKDSFYLHTPLKADLNKTVESRALQKKVLHSVSLWDGKDITRWRLEGDGEYHLGTDSLCMKTWSRADHWPGSEARADDAAAGEYATFGSYIAHLDVRGLDLQKGNRIRFEIFPNCPGLHSPIVRVGFVNNGKIKIPDAYNREGFNAMNLQNNCWNTMTWEIEDIAHDKIEELSFNLHRYGKELSSAEDLQFEIRNISLEQIETPEVVHGWQCLKNTAVFSTTGYFSKGQKTAIANTQETTFSILAEDNAIAFTANIQHQGEFSVLDFTALTAPGTYRIQMGNFISEPFQIGDTIFEAATWKLLNFLFCERCGCPIPGKHGTCHHDIIARHNGLMMSYAGGWHDAADVSQQPIQTAEILHSVLEMAQSVTKSNFLLYERLMEEANWALDYVLRTRFGDGYRATNSGIRRWTDNLIGNMDDCEANVHNHSFENFIMSGVEAFAGTCFAGRDDELVWKCLDAAKADYAFALQRFAKVGVEEIIKHEHASTASLSQYYAAALWAAAQLYTATKEDIYQTYAADFAQKLLSCQESGGSNAPLTGFFYRDATHQTIVHFSHQARDHIFAQALTAAATAMPNHPQKETWETGMRLFGQYLKDLQQYTAPYGMLPAGLYHESELDDLEAFLRVHPQVNFETERPNYKAQLENAVNLGNGYYIKRFPVWFSFRGNSAIHLSMGKAASMVGRYFEDDALCQIAREQLYWTLGKNPSGQSLIYGEGSNYGQQYTALLGETVGEMPVGIQTRGNEDVPYWPPANIATYREVWTTPPGRWLWILADLL